MEKQMDLELLKSNKNVNTSGKVVALSISKKKGIPKSNVTSAFLMVNHGINGDAHAGDWHRQISFLAIESIDKMRLSGLPNLKPGDFAENITTEFIDLPKLAIGTKIKIGNEVKLEVTQIGKECHSRCAIFNTVGDCVMPHEGIFAKVLIGGEIRPNDSVTIEV